MRQPKISVCIPTYNYGKYISHAIESVLNQSFTDFELLVVDDFSNDLTDDILRKYVVQDSRVRYIRHKVNLGMVENWNFCLHEARGKYIKFLFGDDFFTSIYTLDKLYTTIESNKNISLVGSSRTIVSDTSQELDIWTYNDRDIVEKGSDVINTCLLNNKNLIGEPTAVMFRKSQAMRGFDPKYKQLVDLEMWFHLLEQGKYAFINEPLCAFRIHDGQQTSKNTKQSVSLVDVFYIYGSYLCKSYIKLSWFKKKYMMYDYVYQTRKSYLRNEINAEIAINIIKTYGYSSFILIYPFYKVYKPIIKLLKLSMNSFKKDTPIPKNT